MMRRTQSTWRRVILASFACAMLAPPLHAAPTPDAIPAGGARPVEPTVLEQARSDFQQALARESAEDWSGALALFQRVSQVRITPQVRFHIALCEDKIGRSASALGHYRIAISEAKQAHLEDVVFEASSRLDALRSRVPKLVVLRGVGAEYATIWLDGIPLGEVAIGAEMPVDPGPHTLDAQGAGRQPYHLAFSIRERDARAFRISLSPAPPPITTAGSPLSGSVTASKDREPTRGATVAAWAIGGAGVANLIASAIFFGLQQSAISELDASCGPGRNQCPPDKSSTESRGRLDHALMLATLGVGVVGVGTASLLFAFSPGPSSSSSIPASIAHPAMSTGPSLQLRGNF